MNRAKQRRQRNLWPLSLAGIISVASLACSSEESAKIGDPVSVDKSALAGYVGTWEGYVEGFTFISGSDRLRLSLDKEGKGWLQVGDRADVLPPPTDPNVAWPPQYAGLDMDAASLVNPQSLLDGVRYPIVGAKVEAERIRFSINALNAFDTWCTMQAPIVVHSEPPSYGCACGGYSGSPDGGCIIADVDSDQSPIDCGKAMLCGQACACDANTCKARSYDPYLVSVDATLVDEAGTRLEGSVLMPGEVRNTPKSPGPYRILLKR